MAPVRTRTLTNLSHSPSRRSEALRAFLKGSSVGLPLREAFDVVRSLPDGHVAATLGSLRRVGVEAILAAKPSRQRDLCVAIVVGRLLAPSSKLALVRSLHQQSLSSSLAQRLGVLEADEDELYEAMDSLLAGRRGSRLPWPSATCVRARSCSTTSAPPTSRNGTLRWRGSATRAMSSSIARRSSSTADRRRELPSGERGLRGQHRRSQDHARSGEEATRALSTAASHAGG